MPILDLKYPKRLDWLQLHSALQLSDRERALQDGNSNARTAPENIFLNLKESIYGLVTHTFGLQGERFRALGLWELSKNDIYAILLIGGLRLDLASSTVVLDTAVVPLSSDKIPTLISGIQKLREAMPVLQVKTAGNEVIAWKKLLPACVERCRTWMHKPNCEYKSHDNIPISVELHQNPICTCGEGLGFSSAEWNVPAWKGLLPFATRAAISPLFSVSYIERVAGPSRQPPSHATTSATQSRSSSVFVKKPNACWSCGGPGKPSLLTCSKCKKAQYCSGTCQHTDWKLHKASCKAA